jgi:TPP-dependent pyruvate/acetoin dehydrogenase alpha subunit
MRSLEFLNSELLRLRTAQIGINDAIAEKKFKVPVHLALGHEAIAVSVAEGMNPEDVILLNHRNIHFQLALGASYEQLFAEYALQPEGLANGQLGSMNLVAPENRNVYTSNILGNNLAVALGVAQAAKLDSPNRVTWVVTGDGAMEEGVFYETMLCASSWALPLVVIIENNQWSLGTQISERRIHIDVSKLCQSMEIEYVALAGNEIGEYVLGMKGAREMASLGRPVVVEIDVETLGGFFVEEANGARYINYHAGRAKFPNDEVVISKDASDPIFVNLTSYTQGAK